MISSILRFQAVILALASQTVSLQITQLALKVLILFRCRRRTTTGFGHGMTRFLVVTQLSVVLGRCRLDQVLASI